MRYKEQTGTAIVPGGYRTTDGFKLGAWQTNQRQGYKKAVLSANRIKKLEAIGFVWDLHEEAFEEGIRETLRYKEQTGNANAPYSYKTPSGFNLGMWQSHRKKNYKDGMLSAERIKRLEDIGFKWTRKKK